MIMSEQYHSGSNANTAGSIEPAIRVLVTVQLHIILRALQV